jgi:hypothetical protein
LQAKRDFTLCEPKPCSKPHTLVERHADLRTHAPAQSLRRVLTTIGRASLLLTVAIPVLGVLFLYD